MSHPRSVDSALLLGYIFTLLAFLAGVYLYVCVGIVVLFSLACTTCHVCGSGSKQAAGCMPHVSGSCLF
jgi:hypothetical protein